MMVKRRPSLLAAILYGLAAFLLMLPMASNSKIPAALDHANHIAHIVQARMALEERQFPLRVAPWEYEGWRYPAFHFYSQLLHTAGAVIHKLVTRSNPYSAYKLILWISLVFSGFFMYRTAYWLSQSRPGALMTGLVYMAAPYFLINIHAREAFTEAVAQGVLPAALYGSLRCYARPHPKKVIQAARIILTLMADQKILARKEVRVGEAFSLEFPLKRIPLPSGGSAHLKINTDRWFIPTQIDPNSSDTRKLSVRINHLEIVNAHQKNFLDLEQTRNSCTQRKAVRVCRINLKADFPFVQLPILYYPDMIHLTMDGRRIVYFPLPYRDKALVGVQMGPGNHEIRCQFIGLSWANWASGVAWIITLGALGMMAFSRSPKPLFPLWLTLPLKFFFRRRGSDV